MRSLVVAGGVAALVASAAAALPAVADTPLTSGQLTAVVPRVKDVKVFYKNTHGEQAPTAGTGADYIPSQGICVKANGKYATLNKLAKRQAWSTQRIGAGESRGVISITGQYKSAQQAKNKFGKVKQLLQDCPGMVTKDGRETTQDWWPLAKMYKGKAVGTWAVAKEAGEPHFLQYVAIRQTGAQLAFVRYSQLFVGSEPGPAQYQGAVEYLSGVMAQRYRALL